MFLRGSLERNHCLLRVPSRELRRVTGRGPGIRSGVGDHAIPLASGHPCGRGTQPQPRGSREKGLRPGGESMPLGPCVAARSDRHLGVSVADYVGHQSVACLVFAKPRAAASLAKPPAPYRAVPGRLPKTKPIRARRGLEHTPCGINPDAVELLQYLWPGTTINTVNDATWPNRITAVARTRSRWGYERTDEPTGRDYLMPTPLDITDFGGGGERTCVASRGLKPAAQDGT